MPNYKQLLETAYASLSLTNVLTALGITIGGTFVYDLYQRYKNYIQPADATADFLLRGGIFVPGNNAAQNVDDLLDTFRQVNDIRNQRQDTTRASLSFLGRFLSRYLREGHSDIDEIIARNIQNIAPGAIAVSDQQLEIALQRAILGGTRTRGWLTSLARLTGGTIDWIRG
jgi:hypothetical protein